MKDERVLVHLKRYWKRARDSYLGGDHPMAAFFSITLIEEVGKAVGLSFVEKPGQTKLPWMRNHHAKYRIAVVQTLMVNSRVTNKYGDQEKTFTAWFAKDRLFEIRNSALYLDVRGTSLTVPDEAIDQKAARLLVCMGGEVLAEAQGIQLGSGPEEWKEVIMQVDQFRESTAS